MKKISLSFGGSLAVVILTAAGAVAQEPGRGLLAATADGKDVRAVARAELNGVVPQPIPPGTPIEQITIKRGTPPATAGTTGTVVYLNELPAVFLPVGSNALLADDIETEAAGGGMMSFFSVNVFGAGGPGTYSITQLRLYDGCPGEGGNVIVDLLEGTPIVIPARGAIFTVSFDLAGEEIPVPERFWVGLAVNVSDAGWVGGLPPQIGFSEDVLHVAAFPCRAVITGNPPPYNAMNAAVSILNAQPFFTAYEATTLTRPTPLFDGGDGCDAGTPNLDGCGDGVNISHTCEAYSDDIRLIVPDCELHAIALKLAGVGGGMSDVEIELWTDVSDLPGQPIPGTRGCGSFTNDGFLRKIFFDYEPGIMVPRNVWVVLMDNSAASGPVIAGSPPEIGSSQNYIAVYNRATGSWLPITFDGDCPRDGGIPCGIYLMSVRCLGEEPLGACCDRISGTCADNTRVRRCEGSWEPEATCADEPFDVACGLQGCCERDELNPDGATCSNKTVVDCLNAAGEPSDDGRSCSAPAGQECGIPECIGATGSCLQGHGGLGCSDSDCCNALCSFDPFCCEVEFDDQCRDLALDLDSFPICGLIPPANDRCAAAINVNLGITPFTTVNATRDGAPLPIECDSFGSVTILRLANGGLRRRRLSDDQRDRLRRRRVRRQCFSVAAPGSGQFGHVVSDPRGWFRQQPGDGHDGPFSRHSVVPGQRPDRFCRSAKRCGGRASAPSDRESDDRARHPDFCRGNDSGGGQFLFYGL
jgi:hypothetical protein